MPILPNCRAARIDTRCQGRCPTSESAVRVFEGCTGSHLQAHWHTSLSKLELHGKSVLSCTLVQQYYLMGFEVDKLIRGAFDN